MSYHTRSLSQVRGPGGSSSSSAAHSPALVARIEEKKAELENLRELQQLSAAVASQMEALEKELSTLSDGTQGMEGKTSRKKYKPTQAPSQDGRGNSLIRRFKDH